MLYANEGISFKEFLYRINFWNKGEYIKYVAEGPKSFTNFSKKICSPGDHRPKYFMAQYFFQKILHDPSHQF